MEYAAPYELWLLEKNRSYVKIQRINWFYVKIRKNGKYTQFLKIYATKAEKLKPGFFTRYRTVNGKTRLSLMHFTTLDKTFYIVRSCAQLWGGLQFPRDCNVTDASVFILLRKQPDAREIWTRI